MLSFDSFLSQFSEDKKHVFNGIFAIIPHFHPEDVQAVPSVLDFFLTIICTCGTCRADSDGRKNLLSSGSQLVILPQHSLDSLSQVSKDWDGWVLVTTKEYHEYNLGVFTGNLEKSLDKCNVLLLDHKHMDLLTSIRDTTIGIIESGFASIGAFTSSCRGFFATFYSDLLGIASFEQKLLDTITRFACKDLNITIVSNELSVTPYYINQFVKTTFGKTFRQLANEKLTQKIQLRLLFTQDPISLISLDLGFEESSNFTRFFKRHVGISPHEYREANVEKKDSLYL